MDGLNASAIRLQVLHKDDDEGSLYGQWGVPDPIACIPPSENSVVLVSGWRPTKMVGWCVYRQLRNVKLEFPCVTSRLRRGRSVLLSAKVHSDSLSKCAARLARRSNILSTQQERYPESEAHRSAT